MTIRHKLTGETIKLLRTTWDDTYLPKGLDQVYEIVQQDTVLVRTIGDNGTRTNYLKMDRDHAMRMVKKHPMKYDFIEINVDIPIENMVDRALARLYEVYPAGVPVYDYVEKHFSASERDQQLVVDTLTEENLAVTPRANDSFMYMTPNGRRIVEAGGYVLSKRKNGQEVYRPSDPFTDAEAPFIHEKLDELLSKIEKLQVGQSLLYEMVSDEIDELKALTKVLGKKTFFQVLKGKLIDTGLGHLSDEIQVVLSDVFREQGLIGNA